MSEPVYLTMTIVVPTEQGAEVALISAFQQVVSQFIAFDGTPFKCSGNEATRAVDWLHAKFGSRP